MNQSDDRNKREIGLYGEMRFAMELHKRGWQVYRAYIDEKFDFVILKSYCEICQDFRSAWKREATYTNKKGEEKNTTTVTQLCETCHNDSLKMLVRFIQVKTSEGTPGSKVSKRVAQKLNIQPDDEINQYDFHAKLRYHLADSRIFYAWIQVWSRDMPDVNYYIFKTEDVEKFDNLELDSYQVTDNQKTRLKINRSGKVVNEGKVDKEKYRVFDKFLNNFECLEKIMEGDDWK